MYITRLNVQRPPPKQPTDQMPQIILRLGLKIGQLKCSCRPMNLIFKDWRLVSTETAQSFLELRERHHNKQNGRNWSFGKVNILRLLAIQFIMHCKVRTDFEGESREVRSCEVGICWRNGSSWESRQIFHFPSCQLHGGLSLRGVTKLLIFFLSFSHLGLSISILPWWPIW
jgi:hypothetical protein